jgi:hypothetical protein
MWRGRAEGDARRARRESKERGRHGGNDRMTNPDESDEGPGWIGWRCRRENIYRQRGLHGKACCPNLLLSPHTRNRESSSNHTLCDTNTTTLLDHFISHLDFFPNNPLHLHLEPHLEYTTSS